jgi:creatinine amidohydrolase
MDEVRLDRLRPAGIEQAMARAPIAWVPLGALEYHAEHLPNGADGITGQGLLERAARLVGGVVLPWSYLTMGTLALPWSFRYDPALVAEALRQTLRQLPVHGARVAVVHTGHAPLDLDHLVKRVCAEVEGEGIGLRAMGLTYLELNAALGTGLGTDWPVAVDHAAAMETSWIAALAPDLVATDVRRTTGQPRSSASTAPIRALPRTRPVVTPRSTPRPHCSPSGHSPWSAASPTIPSRTCGRSSSATGRSR